MEGGGEWEGMGSGRRREMGKGELFLMLTGDSVTIILYVQCSDTYDGFSSWMLLGGRVFLHKTSFTC